MRAIRTLFCLLFLATALGAAEPAAPAPMKPALLVVDVQNAYLPMMAKEGQDYAKMVINGAITLFRDRGLPVIRVYHTDPKWGPPEGSSEFEFPADIQVRPEDPKVVKRYGSAFKKTDLDAVLKKLGVNTLFVTGLSATGCVLATYMGAEDLDYTVFLVRDSVMSPNAAHTAVMQDVMETVPYSALKVMLAAAGK
jgi:nicotinamidase-related amidase